MRTHQEFTWAAIAEAAGTTRQAAQQRWGKAKDREIPYCPIAIAAMGQYNEGMTNTAATKTIEIKISAERGKTFTEVVRLVKLAGGTFDGERKVWTVSYDATGLHPVAVEKYGEAVAALNARTSSRLGFYAEYMTITAVTEVEA